MEPLPTQKTVRQAYSIAYALFRLGETLPSKQLRAALEKRGVGLLTASLENDGARAEKVLRQLEYLLAFGRDTGSIEGQTVEIILAEIERSYFPAEHLHSNRQLSRAELFPKDIPAIGMPRREGIEKPSSSAHQAIAGSPEEIPSIILVDGRTTDSSDLNQEGFKVRKEAILGKIRQTGNAEGMGCRMRDIQDTLPDVSERTLRYDLQRLVSEGLLERVGNSGPSTYYRLRQEARAGM